MLFPTEIHSAPAGHAPRRVSVLVISLQTILQSRAPLMRKLYALKLRLFTSWCGDCQLDPVNCPFGTVLEFLQACFSAGLTHSTLKVYVVAIAVYHAPLRQELSSYTFPPVRWGLRAEKLMLSGGSGCYPITSSPVISPRIWLTQLKVWRPPRPFWSATQQGGLRPSYSSGSWQWFTSHSWLFCSLAIDVLFHTRQGFASLVAWTPRSPGVLRRSSSSWRGTSLGYVYNPSSSRKGDTASRGHTSSIPTRASFLKANAGCT